MRWLWAAGWIAAATLLAVPVAASAPVVENDLLRMSEQADALDKADLDSFLSRIIICTSQRNFICAEGQLAKATQVANSTEDKARLIRARDGVSQERVQMRREIAERKAAEQARRDEARRIADEEIEEAKRLDRERIQQMIADNAPQGNYIANGITEGLATFNRDSDRVTAIHNELVENLAAQQAQRQRREQEQRERQRAQDERNHQINVENRRTQLAAERADQERRAQSQAEQRSIASTSTASTLPSPDPQLATRRAQQATQDRELLALEQRRAAVTSTPVVRMAESSISTLGGAPQRTAPRQIGENTAPAPKAPAIQSANTGKSAMWCVTASRESDHVLFVNNCPTKIFVVWCGELKYSKARCGDGPAGNSYFTQSINIPQGESRTTTTIGTYQYGACEGGINFGSREYQSNGAGGSTCRNYNSVGPSS